MLGIQVTLAQEEGKEYWHCYSDQLKIHVGAGKPRAALVKFANTLKRIKNEDLEGLL